jgi:ribose transport system substrate-binding protein
MPNRLRTSVARIRHGVCSLAAAFFVLATITLPANAQTTPRHDDMRQAVAKASEPAPAWSGPRTGPTAKLGVTIAILAEDLRNGGILGVAQGVREAARVMGWNIRVFDAGGTPAGRNKASTDAAASNPDGLILIGGDAAEMQARLAVFQRRGTPAVGWHVGAHAGPITGSLVAMNVSTDPLDVARITAMAAIAKGGDAPGVVIFTDSNYEIAMAKSKAMASIISSCPTCTLLEVRDLPIARANELMPAVTRELLAKYGKRWTHALAINDIYFDYAVPELIKQGIANNAIRLLSAGDGSPSAFMRIQAQVFQTGTVAEPLNLHGWQLVDELNRLLNQQPVSGYIVPVHLVAPDNVAFDGGPRFLYDPNNRYRDIYRQIWQR